MSQNQTTPTWTSVATTINGAVTSANTLTGMFLRDDSGNVVLTDGPNGAIPVLLDAPSVQDALALAYALTLQVAAIQTQFAALRASLGG